ncbi:SixA phosphatase family protein [Kitasatospora sp. NPDC098663]|uniref:SixA phosphatase family protein n=1 Tax=Kitasatospora sp. NPDC098663 TaxID=3364096 RepID=UPI00380720E7
MDTVTDRAGGVGRRLVVLRHAKAAWPDVADAERPLAKRGLRDAPAAGRWLLEHGVLPELVVCSPARRTRQTWELVAAQWDRVPPVDFDARVYGAEGQGLVSVVRQLAPWLSTVLLVGHQPAVQDLVLHVAAREAGAGLERLREKFPTSGIAVLEVAGPWADLAAGSAHLADFAVPRGG